MGAYHYFHLNRRIFLTSFSTHISSPFSLAFPHADPEGLGLVEVEWKTTSSWYSGSQPQLLCSDVSGFDVVIEVRPRCDVPLHLMDSCQPNLHHPNSMPCGGHTSTELDYIICWDNEDDHVRDSESR